MIKLVGIQTGTSKAGKPYKILHFVDDAPKGNFEGVKAFNNFYFNDLDVEVGDNVILSYGAGKTAPYLAEVFYNPNN